MNIAHEVGEDGVISHDHVVVDFTKDAVKLIESTRTRQKRLIAEFAARGEVYDRSLDTHAPALDDPYAPPLQPPAPASH